LMRGVVHNAGGTGRGASGVSAFIGGKTGTTSNYIDAWFVGFSPKVALGVWTGFDNNKTLGWGETGSKSALPIWKGYMKAALEKLGDIDFTVPKEIVNVLIDKKTGKLAGSDSSETMMEVFASGTEPGAEKRSISKEDEDVPADIFEDDDYYNN
jgi:penicillin-binding protein 1A